MKRSDIVAALCDQCADSFIWRSPSRFCWRAYYANWREWVIDTHQITGTMIAKTADMRRVLESLEREGLVYVNEFDEINRSMPYGKRNYRYYVTDLFIAQNWNAIVSRVIADIQNELNKARGWFRDYWMNGAHDPIDLSNMARDESEMIRMERALVCLENGIDITKA